MAIAAAEVIPYWLPFRRDYVTARGRLARREMVLLRLRDDEGREGWGEAVPLSLRGGDTLARTVEDLEILVPHLIGLDPAARDLWRPAGAKAAIGAPWDRLGAPARCAALTALADLEAKRVGTPLWRLLGAEGVVPVPCNATLISGSPDAVAADAARWAAAGFTTFKLKVGLEAEGRVRPNGDPDLSQIEAVRTAVGAKARIRLDANGAWSLERAEAVLRAAAELGIELVEQPVATIPEMAELRRRLAGGLTGRDAPPPVDPAPRAPGQTAAGALPIAADESVTGPAEALAARDAGACDLATVKLSKIGQVAADLGGALPFYLSSALDGPVGIAAAAHAYQAISGADRASLPDRPPQPPAPLAQGLATQRLFAATIAARECDLTGPLLHVPEGPGLGIEIDPEALAAHRY